LKKNQKKCNGTKIASSTNGVGHPLAKKIKRKESRPRLYTLHKN